MMAKMPKFAGKKLGGKFAKPGAKPPKGKKVAKFPIKTKKK
jgi:hypothetical protein